MELFGSTTSPFVRHCRIALEQAKQEYKLSIVDYATSAKESPAQKMPYLRDGQTLLTDSASIVMYARSQNASPFPASVSDYEIFTLASTIADTAVNIFLLEKDGITSTQSAYLKRQEERMSTALAALDTLIEPEKALSTDGHIRTACLVDWILFRERADLTPYTKLLQLIAHASEDPMFEASNPRL